MRIFVDTFYWVAITNPRDPWRQAAREARDRPGRTHLVTTEEVLMEFLTAVSAGGRHLRSLAVRSCRATMVNPGITVVPQSHQSFIDGLEFYESRPDKEYSLVDCISMGVMKAEGITGILTNDHHFSQEGFQVLVQS